MDTKKYGGYVALLLAMVLMLSYSIEWLRNGIGMTIDGVFGPLLDSYGVPFFALIIILSTLTGLYSSLIQKYTINYERMQEVQQAMKEFNKEYREAQLSGDEKRVKKLEAKRNMMMQEQLEMSQGQFKPMAYIMLVSVPIFFWLLYRLPFTHADIVFPFMGKLALTASALGPMPAWMIWYMICSLMVSQVIRKALNIGGI